MRGLMNSWAAISGLDRPSPASRAICGLAGGELGGGPGGARGYPLAGGAQLARGSFREPVGSHGGEHLVREAQLLPGVDAPVLAAQPLAVEQIGAPEFHADAGAAKAVDRLAVEGLGRLALAEQCPRAGLDAKRPVSPAGAGGRREPLEGASRELGYPAAGRCLDELGYRPVGKQIRGRVLTGLLRRGQRVGIPA